MITFNRTGSIAPGKAGAAIEFAHGIASYMKDAFGVALEVRMPIGGNPQRIRWTARYKDLAAVESVSNKMLADKKYMALAAKGADLFIAGSLHDSLWRDV